MPPLSNAARPPDSVRVVISGIGLRTPLGSDRESTWKSLIDGRSGSRWLDSKEWTGEKLLAGAPCDYPSPDFAESTEPVVQLALKSAMEAIHDAGVTTTHLSSERTGVVFGTSKGGFATFAHLTESSKNQFGDAQGRHKVDGATLLNSEWLDVFPDAASRAITNRFNCRGPSLCPVLACATGLAACQRAAELIRSGVCDVVLAGSSDASIQPAILGSFQRLGVLANLRLGDPSMACRPFDRDRTGFVIGEGAACLVFESLPHAQRRNARWYGEWLSGRMLTDPSGLTQLDPDAMSLIRLLSDLQRDVDGLPDYLNLHGTATVMNDRSEHTAIRKVFGDRASDMSCSSLKGGLGHMLGAAGSVELAATLLAIRDQTIPPTVNLFNQDPEFNLDLTPRSSKQRQIEMAWKLSLGFGGHLVAAAVGRLRGAGDRTRE